MLSKKTTAALTPTLLVIPTTAIAYYIFGITNAVSLIIFAIFFASSIFFLIKNKLTDRQHISKPSFFAIGTILIDLFLIATLIQNRTTDLLVSPWQKLDPVFFILFALSTFLMFVAFSKKNYILALSSLHLFVMFAVAPVIYTLGFGFDAFIHRATEIWIQTHGFILPKTPYYIGQYGLVVLISNITRIPIFFIDVYLAPVIAAITIPITVIFSLANAFKFPRKRSAIAIFLIPFIPFLSLHLTTPHNLVILLAILAIFTLLPSLQGYLQFRVPILLAVSALFTHPLVGAPLVTFIFAAIAIKHYENKTFLKKCIITALPITIALIPPILFTANILLSGNNFPTFANPIAKIPDFLSLFARPYWYAKNSPIKFEILYAWQWLITPSVIAISAYGFFIARKIFKNTAILTYPLTTLGLIIGAWFLKSWIIFPDVVAYEQGEYPMRLIKSAIIYILPFGMIGLNAVYANIKSSAAKYASLSLAAILLSVSLYLSYPQKNAKARFPGFNVTAADFRAVEWIHNNERQEIDYIVLSNQLVSAAALTKYSFAKYFRAERDPAQGGGNANSQQLFYYSLPTGGLLYQQYGKMIYEGQKREYMNEAMKMAGVKKAYFVVNSYWANSDKIIAGAQKTADGWKIFDNGAVWVFYFSL